MITGIQRDICKAVPWLTLVRLITFLPICAAPAADFRAGAHAIDVSPAKLPAIRNGGFTERLFDKVDDPLHARCLVLSDGKETIAIAVVDSCMIPRALCDEAKAIAEKKTGIPINRILIAATHTHSAPSVMDYCLGTRKDEAYAKFLVPKIAEGIALAHANLAPARAGWTAVDAPDHTHCRRWLRQPGKPIADPFGDNSVRAMMHPGHQNPEYAGPAGPVDTGLSLLSIRTEDGRPLCVLANYSMHYFGSSAGFSADYFGDFARFLENRIAGDAPEPPPLFVGIMSQGTSGDLQWMDYSQPKRTGYTRAQYAAELGTMALEAIAGIEHRDDITLAMAEKRIELQRRLPGAGRLAWAREINAARGDRRPKDRPEVYAEQAVWIDANPAEEIVLQAVRIGDAGITAIPHEVYGITGLKLKAQSPLDFTFTMELANGAAGYIPPPEQHYLGGYTTWPARTAGLEVNAEPRIVDTLLDLLEDVSGGKKRRPPAADLYSEEQRRAIESAKSDDNNRANRGR